MFKMIFGRRVDPTAPSWDHREDQPLTPFEQLTSEPSLVPAMEATWAWMCGNPGAAHVIASRTDEWIDTLHAPTKPGDDATRVGAAYNLGRAAPTDDDCLSALVRALSSDVQGCRRAAVVGLQAAGAAAVPPPQAQGGAGTRGGGWLQCRRDWEDGDEDAPHPLRGPVLGGGRRRQRWQ